jgi:hypothetical protein
MTQSDLKNCVCYGSNFTIGNIWGKPVGARLGIDISSASMSFSSKSTCGCKMTNKKKSESRIPDQKH